jgi:hypothetical protein
VIVVFRLGRGEETSRRLLQEGVPLFIHLIQPSPSVTGGANFVLELLPELQKLHFELPETYSRAVSRPIGE